MHLVHTTADGRQCFISQMKDSHLLNTINLLLTKIETGTDLGSAMPSVTPGQAAIYGIDIVKAQKSALKRVPSLLGSLYPYLAEAMLRWGLNNDTMIEMPSGDPQAAANTVNAYEKFKGIVNRLRAINGDRSGQMAPLPLTNIRALPHSPVRAAADDGDDEWGMAECVEYSDEDSHFPRLVKHRRSVGKTDRYA